MNETFLLGLTNHSLCHHQKTQRSKEGRLGSCGHPEAKDPPEQQRGCARLSSVGPAPAVPKEPLLPCARSFCTGIWKQYSTFLD